VKSLQWAKCAFWPARASPNARLAHWRRAGAARIARIARLRRPAADGFGRVSLDGMSMSGHDLEAGTAENYRAFAGEARGRSPQYEELAMAVAGNPQVLEFLNALRPAKRQPNLLFAAACYLLGEPRLCCPPWRCSRSRLRSSRSARARASPCSRTGTPTTTAAIG